jgi:DNA invertase Pin-like site-specific DNA recombinase
MISQRTKAALAAAKARGVKLGNPHVKAGDVSSLRAARRARSERADAYAADVMPYIEAARNAGCISLGDLARALTARGIETAAGNREWSRCQVFQLLKRCAPP